MASLSGGLEVLALSKDGDLFGISEHSDPNTAVVTLGTSKIITFNVGSCQLGRSV